MKHIDDPRSSRNRIYNIETVLTLIVIGFLMGKNDFVNIEHILNDNIDLVKKIVPLPEQGIPSHDTFSRVCRLIKPIDLITKVGYWLVEVAPEFAMRRLAIDGKALRGVRREGRPPVMLNVYSPWFRAFICHYNIPEKSSELSELPKLLGLLVLKDVMVTADAMATHPNILEMIVSNGGHAILPVKDNNRTLNSDLKRYMNDMIKSGDARVEKYRECESGHGRGETREIYLVRSNEAVLDERFSRYVGSVALVVRKRYMKSSGKESREEICYICDKNDISAEELHREIRAHWAVENNLHNVLDTVFYEDHNGTSEGNGPANVSFLRKIALSFLSALYEKESGKQTYQRIRDKLSKDYETLNSLINGDLYPNLLKAMS